MKFFRLHILIVAAVAAICLPFVGGGQTVASAHEAEDVFSISFHTPVGDFKYEDRLIEPTDWLVAEEIHTRNINAPLKDKRAMMSRAVRAGASYERAVTLCMPLIKDVIDEIEQKMYIPYKDAALAFNPDSRPPFTVSREKYGRKLDREKAFKLVYAAVKNGSGGDFLALEPDRTEPDITSDELIAQTFARAEFSTEFSDGNADRAHNIKLAMRKINGSILMPNEEFSFNGTVGARTEKNGFRQAKIIIGGEYVLGYGGGVCQASTTLYNAALIAGMDVTAVRNHSLTSSYVEPSLDAMVNSGTADLKFVNPTDSPVYIAAGVSGNRAWVRIYGLKNEYKIVPRSVILSTTPPPDDEKVTDTEHKYLPVEAVSGDSLQIRKGKEGVKSEAYLEYYKDNILVRRNKIRSDSYNSLRGITVLAP